MANKRNIQSVKNDSWQSVSDRGIRPLFILIWWRSLDVRVDWRSQCAWQTVNMNTQSPGSVWVQCALALKRWCLSGLSASASTCSFGFSDIDTFWCDSGECLPVHAVKTWNVSRDPSNFILRCIHLDQWREYSLCCMQRKYRPWHCIESRTQESKCAVASWRNVLAVSWLNTKCGSNLRND